MKRHLVISRTPKECAYCNIKIDIGEECIRADYRIFYHKKCMSPIRVYVKCPYKNEEDFENNYLKKLVKERIIILFKDFNKKENGWFDSELLKLKNLSDIERKEKFENATIEEIILDFMKYILIVNYKDLGWSLEIK